MLFLLVSNRDDSNRNDIKYANPHLHCCLEAKTFKTYTITLRHIILIYFLDFDLFAAYTFIEIWVTGITYYLSDSIPTVVICFIFTSK